MNRIDRLFGILTLLQSKKYVTGEKIAEKFNISVRSVYRDIKALNEQGIPVSFEPYRGYFIVNGYFLQPVSFSTEEANALLLMESIVSGFADKSIHHHYSNALTKVKSVLRSSQKDSIEFLANNIKFQAPPCFIQHAEYLATIQQAIAQRLVVEIEYTNLQKEISKTQGRTHRTGLLCLQLASDRLVPSQKRLSRFPRLPYSRAPVHFRRLYAEEAYGNE